MLLVVYSFSSIGATVKAHMCAGKVQKCLCNKSNKKDSCCAEKTTFLKKQDSHPTVEAQKNKQLVSIAVVPSPIYLVVVKEGINEATNQILVSKKGLLFSGPPIYVLDCLYLI